MTVPLRQVDDDSIDALFDAFRGVEVGHRLESTAPHLPATRGLATNSEAKRLRTGF